MYNAFSYIYTLAPLDISSKYIFIAQTLQITLNSLFLVK